MPTTHRDTFVDEEGTWWGFCVATQRWESRPAATIHSKAPSSPPGRSDEWAAPPVTNLDYNLSRELPWFIGPCIKPYDFTYFVGADGEGKSTLLADIMVAMAGASNNDLDPVCLAGAWPINKAHLWPDRPWLIINSESAGPDDWNHRLSFTLLSRGHAPRSELDHAIRRRFDFIDSGDIPLRRHALAEDSLRLAEWIVAQKYQGVIIDPIYGLFRPDDPGEDYWVNHGVKPLVTHLRNHHCTTFAIAHNNLNAQRAKRGPRQSNFRPHGSGQQNGLMDCRFGIYRPPNTPRATMVTLHKARRGGWLPVHKAQIRLLYGTDAGFASYTYRNSEWEIHNPKPAVLSTAAEDLIRVLPESETFTAKDLPSSKLRTFERIRDEFLLPQDLLHAERQEDQRGRPVLYRWSEIGMRVHAHLTGKKQPPPTPIEYDA